jgi:hypothetical protein
MATATSTPTPTATHTPTVTLTPTATSAFEIPAVCQSPDGWTVYVLGEGETLVAVARAVGIPLSELRTANCIPGAAIVFPGQFLAVPRLPERAVATAVPVFPIPTDLPGTPSGVVPLAEIGCTTAGVVIRSPRVGETVAGYMEIAGTADVPGFIEYQISIRSAADQAFDVWSTSTTPVRNGTLALVNTDFFDDGLHLVRLSVTVREGEAPLPCAIPVIFR